MSSAKTQIVKSLAAPEAGPVDLLIVAGEHSGDEHAARVVRGLLAKNPGLKICALGGPELAKAGAQLLHDLTATSVAEWVKRARANRTSAFESQHSCLSTCKI